MGSSAVNKTAELLKAQSRIFELRFCYKTSACLKCAVELGIPDVLHNYGNPMTLSQLTSALPINPSKAPQILRVLRILVRAGILLVHQKITENSCSSYTYSLTSTGELLLKDEPFNSRALVLLDFDFSVLKAWASLGDWFQNDDRTPFQTATGKKSFWELCLEEETTRNLFHQGMATDSACVTKVLIEDCRFVFEEVKSLVDVGGGTGEVARSLVKAFPGLKCLVLDRPEVVENLLGTNNVEFVQGNMFEDIPQANAIMLKWVLHNWSDEDCVKILKNCKKAIPPKEEGGKIIVIDTVMENNEESYENKSVEAEAQISMDMCMLINLNGKERSENEFAALFQTVGFSGYKVFPVLGMRSLIEVYP